MGLILAGRSWANPPHLGHLALIKAINSFKPEKIYWIPRGLKRDRIAFVEPEHRKNMSNMTFVGNISCNGKLEIIYDEIDGHTRPNIKWLSWIKKNNPNSLIMWYTGSDVFMPKEKYGGLCEVEKEWPQGERLMQEWHFMVITREGCQCALQEKLRLPKHYITLDAKLPNISGADIKKRIEQGEPIDDLVTRPVARYIRENKLYGYKN